MQLEPEGESSGGLWSALNTKLFDVPKLSAVHEVPREGLFRSFTVRWLWRLWTRRLTPGGRSFFLATGLFFGYGATSLDVQAFVPLAYAMILWLLALCTLMLEKPRVRLDVDHPERIAAGEDLKVSAQVTQLSAIPGGGARVLPDRLPMDVDFSPPDGAPIPPLRRGQSATTHFTLRPQKRGVYRFCGYRVESDFPFGLMNSERRFDVEDQLIVYPRFEPLDRMDLPMGRRYQPGGVSFAAPRGESAEYIGNRDYREGDDVRHIDWRSTARLSRPIVREYREEYFLRAAIVLDTHLPRLSSAACEDFERAISLCAACGDYMNRADYLVDILTAGPNLYHLLAGRGLASLDQMLDILACVNPSREPPWTTLEPEVQANLEQITSVICIFLDWDQERRAFATRLAQSGSAVKVVIVREDKPALDPLDSWPGEVPILGRREFEVGVRHL